MSKSIKFKDNTYIDSTGVVYNHNQLDSVLADIISKSIKNSGTWADNHNYIRFNNGMAVCYGQATLSNLNGSESSKGGALYWIDHQVIELPIHFKDTTFRVVCIQNGNSLVFPYGCNPVNTDHFEVHLASPTLRQNTTVRIDYIAWGFSKA